MQNLKVHWLLVLDATARAVADATVIHGLADDEGRAWAERLRVERAWVETALKGEAVETLLRSAYAYRDGGTAW